MFYCWHGRKWHLKQWDNTCNILHIYVEYINLKIKIYKGMAYLEYLTNSKWFFQKQAFPSRSMSIYVDICRYMQKLYMCWINSKLMMYKVKGWNVSWRQASAFPLTCWTDIVHWQNLYTNDFKHEFTLLKSSIKNQLSHHHWPFYRVKNFLLFLWEFLSTTLWR